MIDRLKLDHLAIRSRILLLLPGVIVQEINDGVDLVHF